MFCTETHSPYVTVYLVCSSDESASNVVYFSVIRLVS